MKKFFFILAQLCLLILVSANIVRAQNHTQTVSVTNVAANITADGNYNQVLLRENSATPTAAFSIILAGSSTAINYPAGTQFLFSGNFSNGQVIGTIQATTAGPFTFIAVEASGPPSMSVKNTIIGGGSGNATSIQGLAVSSSAPTGGVNCFETNSGDTQALWVACGSGGTVTAFSSGNLSPLFTVSIATSTTTPAQSFTLSTAAANTVFGNCTGSTAGPSYCSVTGAMLPVPSATTLGGVESITVVSHNFLTGISTSGIPTQAQPAFTDISGTLAIAQGGTGATSAANALINLHPVASEVGDLIYCSSFSSGCTAWSILPGNTSGTKVLQETSSGVPSWVAGGASGVSSFSGDDVIVTNSLSTGAVTTSISGTSGGIVYFSSSSGWASSALLTHYGLIYGGGSGGSPVALGAATNGQLVIGSTGVAPVLSTLTAGQGITVTNGAGTITISSSPKVCGITSTSDQISSTTAFATTCSVPSTNLVVSSVVHVVVGGMYTTTATASPKLNIAITVNGNNTCTNPLNPTLVVSQSNNTGAWTAKCDITIVSTGSGGTALVTGYWQQTGSSSTNGFTGETYGASASGNSTVTPVTYATNATATIGVSQLATMVSGQTANLTTMYVSVE
jgi:hypothetical protein